MNLADYFALHRHKPTYDFGSRVFAYWNKIPIIGSLYSDTVINEEEGPRFSIHLDLPIKYKGETYTILIDKQSEFKKIKLLTEPKL